MARSTFGGGIADFVVDASSGNLRLKQTILTLWSARTGGTQQTDLKLSGSTVTEIPTDAYGSIPEFQGPDGVTELWAQAVGGTSRARLISTDGATSSEIADTDLQDPSGTTSGLITGRRMNAAFAEFMAEHGYPYVLHYISGAWEPLTNAPTIVRGNPILWDSTSDSNAPTPPESRDDDYWDKLV